MNKNKNETLKMLDKAEELYKKFNDTTHGGIYFDADSILTDYMTDVPTGLFSELCHTYRTCDDTDVFEALFESLTGISFQEFLERCVNETRLLVLPKGTKIKTPNFDLKLPINPQERVWVITNAFGLATAPVGQLEVRSALVQRVCITKEDDVPQLRVDIKVYPDEIELKSVALNECHQTREQAEQTLSAMQAMAEDSGNMDEQEPPVIDSFRGEYDFLSNFFPCPVTYNNKSYVCAEAAFQAQKCPERADEFTTLTASKAKRLGRQVTITTQDWDTQRVPIMSEIIWEKFAGNPQLTEKLLETGNAELVEGNTWGDKFWGVVNGEGENQLGKILMATRDKLRLLQSVM